MNYPKQINNWCKNQECSTEGRKFISKINPVNGEEISKVVISGGEDINLIVESSEKAYEEWNKINIIERSELIRAVVKKMEERQNELAELIAFESGKSVKDSIGEVGAAIECGYYFAGEGRRFNGIILTSSAPNRDVRMIRESLGMGLIIVPFNNPSASIAWKLFPALICGNTVVIKSHEDTPFIAIWYAKIFKEMGLPDGVISVIQGDGKTGQMLSENNKFKFISFTGSEKTAIKIIKSSAEYMTKVSIESGGKNPFVVCQDADIDKAVDLALASAFVDAGQRCAAASRLIIFDKVYDEFKAKFVKKVEAMKVGIGEDDSYGAIISEKRMNEILGDIKKAKEQGANIVCGGGRMGGKSHKQGFFIAPTVMENVSPDDYISNKEVFGPVVVLYKVKNIDEAINLANNSKYKLSSSIHTKDTSMAYKFINNHKTGVVRVNGPTFGSEPHMPFGGQGLSGNGWREPGEKALDFYSEWKQISFDY